MFPPLLATHGRIHKGDCDMRTGAIFERGSCRALKWMALVGAVVALSVGEAVAQGQRIVVSPASITVPEAAEASTNKGSPLSVKLSSEPASNVTVSLAESATVNADFQYKQGAAEWAETVTDLTFTTGNWSTAQTVYVRAVDNDTNTDTVNATDGSATLTVSATNLSSVTVELNETDNEPTMVQAKPEALSLTEGGASDYFIVSLDGHSPLGTNVSVALTIEELESDDNATFQYSLTGTAGTFDALPTDADLSANFDSTETATQRVYVQAANDDNAASGEVTLLIRGAFEGTDLTERIASKRVTLTEVDDDRETVPPGEEATAVTVTPSSLTVNEGDAGTFIVSLDGKPETDVTVTVATPVPDEGSDNADFRYTYGTVNASQLPTDMVFPFAKGAVPTQHRVTVSAWEDSNAVSGRTVLNLGTATAGIKAGKITLNEADNDGAAVVLSRTALQVQEGGDSETYTIRLGSAPQHADVKVGVSVTNVNANVGAAPGSVTFTSMNWDQPQTVTVTAGRDTNTTNGSATISHKITTDDGEYAALRAGPILKVTEIDSVRTVTLTLSSDSVTEGQTATITATLGNPGDFTGAPTLTDDVTIALTKKKGSTAETGDYTVSAITIPAGARSAAETLTAKHDRDADDEALTLTAAVTGGGGALQIEGGTDELALDIKDDDTYTLTSDRTEIPEGEKATLTVKVEPAAALDTKVAIDLYRASGATVSPGPGDTPDHMIIGEGQSSATFELTTAKDPGDKEHETIVAMAKAGAPTAARGSLKQVGDELELMVRDAQADTVYTLTADPTFVTEAGGEQGVTVTVTADKAAAADTTLTLAVGDASTATATDDYSLMPASPSVMIAKGEKSGMVELMVTPVADGMDEADETIVLTAMMDDAMVGNAVTVTLIDSDSTSSGITAKSNAEAAKVFEDAIMKAGGLHAGGDSAYVDMSMLFNMADATMSVAYTVSSSDTDVLGLYTSATDSTLSDVTLRLVPMMEGMSTVTVMAEAANGMMAVQTLTAFTCTGACVNVNVDVGPAGTPVPALPLFGQGLLAAFLLAAGAYRRYRNR